MKIEIHNRWTNACIWSGDIEDTGSESRNLGVAVVAAHKAGADLRGAVLNGGIKIASLRVLTGLYGYQCMAFVTGSGAPWVRMGCLLKSVEDWDRVTIRASNPGEFPDDGSAKCEERVRAFDSVRSMAIRMAEEWKSANASELSA